MRGCLALLLSLSLFGCTTAPIIALGPDADADPLVQQLALDARLQGSHAVPGNQVRVLRDGVETLPAMFQAMAAAQHHIHLEYFTFEDVRVGDTTLGDLLVAKLNQGVAVAVSYDGFGSLNAEPEFLQRLRQAGAKLLEYHPLDAQSALKLQNPNDRDHRKIMVIDGRVAFVGGVNLDHVYENQRDPVAAADGDTAHAYWRDTDARIEGPAVAELQKLFLANWEHEKGPALPPGDFFPALPAMGSETVRIIGSAPNQDQPLFYAALLNAVHGARHSVSMGTGYFVPTHEEREEMQNASERGVSVRLVLPSVSDSDGALAAGRAFYSDLLEAGIRIFELHGMVLHSKFVTIDSVWTAIGSSNFDRRSVNFNNEVDAIVFGRKTAQAAEALFDRDIARSEVIDLAHWHNRPFDERSHEFFSRFWEFLM
jgi:cardiolipin synthase